MPVCPYTFGAGVIIGVKHEGSSQSTADFRIVFLHVAEIDVFHEVLGVRVVFEYPADDLNAFAHRLSVFAIQTWSGIAWT